MFLKMCIFYISSLQSSALIRFILVLNITKQRPEDYHHIFTDRKKSEILILHSEINKKKNKV